MSKILNRPMFRGGGRVSSYNTGITSGLGYAGGGQVPPKRGLVDGPGGYAGAPLGVPIFLPKPVAGVPMVIPQAGVPAVIGGGGGGGVTGGSLLRGGSSLARYLPEMVLPFVPTAGIASLLNPETESEKEAMRALEEGVGLSGEAVDPELYQALSEDVGKTRAAEDRVFSQGSTSALQKIYDVLNPSKETILKRIQEANQAQGEPIIKTRAYQEEKAKLDQAKKLQEQLEKQAKEKKKDLVTQPTGTQTTVEPERSNADVINEYMDMFKSVLGTDQDELTRQKYLELAKFGTNLLAQGGGKRGLMEKIGAAGTQSLEGLSKIMAQERASDRQIKLAAIQAAMKEMDPGTVGKTVKDLQKLGMSKSKAIEYVTKSGTGVREQTKEARIKEYTTLISDSDGAPKDKRTARVIAEKIDKTNVGFDKFEPLPTKTKPQEGGYYYDTIGNLYIGTKTGAKRIL